VLPYVVHAAVVVAGVLVVLRVPETAPRRRREAGDPAPDPLLRRGDRLLAVTALGPVAVCVYAFPSTLIAGLPLLVALPGNGVLASGVLAGLTLGTGAVVAPYQRRLGSWTAVAAAVVGALGFALTALAATTGATPLLLPAALLLGAGGGWSLAAGLALTGRLAPEIRRGALTGVFYTTAYLGSRRRSSSPPSRRAPAGAAARRRRGARDRARCSAGEPGAIRPALTTLYVVAPRRSACTLPVPGQVHAVTGPWLDILLVAVFILIGGVFAPPSSPWSACARARPGPWPTRAARSARRAAGGRAQPLPRAVQVA
jgi:hypothetical protein